MIPKVIHYCWFGGKEKPEKIINCINSWKSFFPDFEIKEWNESNFNMDILPYVKEAYFAKKYAFVSDICRITALATEGGLYLDTDVEILKRFPDDILNEKAFLGFESGFNDYLIATAVIGSEPNNPFFLEFLDSYKETHFFSHLRYNEETNVDRITKALVDEGLLQNDKHQIINGIHIYPKDYFCNYDFHKRESFSSENSLARHLYFSSWKENKKTFFLRRKAELKTVYTILFYKIISFWTKL